MSSDLLAAVCVITPVQLVGGRGVWKARCPFHEEKTPAFTVDTKTNEFHCLGCGVHGDLAAFKRRVWELGRCPTCGGQNLRDKGSSDKCMDCGERISLSFEDGITLEFASDANANYEG